MLPFFLLWQKWVDIFVSKVVRLTFICKYIRKGKNAIFRLVELVGKYRENWGNYAKIRCLC